MICQDLPHEHLLLPVHPLVPGFQPGNRQQNEGFPTDWLSPFTRFLNGLLGGMKLSPEVTISVTFHVDEIKKGSTPAPQPPPYQKWPAKTKSVPRSKISQKCQWMDVDVDGASNSCRCVSSWLDLARSASRSWKSASLKKVRSFRFVFIGIQIVCCGSCFRLFASLSLTNGFLKCSTCITVFFVKKNFHTTKWFSPFVGPDLLASDGSSVYNLSNLRTWKLMPVLFWLLELLLVTGSCAIGWGTTYGSSEFFPSCRASPMI